jgi:L-asparaginase II
LTRGKTVESIHYGAIAVVDPMGSLVASYGDPDGVAFLRSTAKPFQALPFIEAKGHEHFGFTSREVALICASHSGTEEHVAGVSGIQAKVGLTSQDLVCGTHPPYHQPTADALKARGEKPSTNHHNCSGKHTGMLAHAIFKGLPTENYLDMAHPVQRSILQAFAEMCELPPEEVQLGTDGCSAPNFAVPFYNAAWALARLADPSGLSPERAEACRTITAAMMAHPDIVAGPDRSDTALMQAAKGRIVVKGGAEGYQGIGVMPGAMGEGSPSLGIAIKISDGDGRDRARPAVALETLRQLGALSEEELAELSDYGPKKDVLNWRKIVVGEMRPTFTLNKN